jgi:NitT/TauT family transport system permease protein
VLVPLVLLIVQDDVGTEVVVIVFAAVWPVLINTVYGLREVDPEAKETLRSFGFGPLAVTWRVSLPSAAPFIATGIRIAASLAFVVAIAVELVGVGMNGLGAFAGQAQSGTDAVPVMIAVAIWAGIIGLAINAVFVGAERRAFRWHHVLSMTALSGART